MSRRRTRPQLVTKAAALPGSAGGTWSQAQIDAVALAGARAALAAGGAMAKPLPRLQPQVPFGPGIPLDPAPINPLRPDTGRAEPRGYEYPVTFNLPGFGTRLIPWKVLRDAADMITLFRRCIEIRKAEVATLDWDITISAKAIERAQRQDPGSARSDIEKAMRARVDPHIGRLVDFWEQPDPRNGRDFIAWANTVLEEYFVLDAIAIYPRPTRGGGLYGLEVLDGSTIKPLLDNDGFRPMPPNPAYQQILYGFPRGEFVADTDDDRVDGAYPADQLVYKVHNTRTFTPYGFSAVEQALSDGELYLRRIEWLKSEYTDGVMPAGWLKTGDAQAEWSPQMLKQYERELNDFYSGNTAARQRWRLLPPGIEPDQSRDLGERYRPDFDLYLIKLVASHFDTTIAELGFTEQGGLGSTGWHEGQADVQDRKATQPTLRRLQALCTTLMRRHLGAPSELEFRILGLESEDEDAADEVANRRFANGRMTLNEDRDRTGLPRYTFAEADMPMLVTQRGLVFLEGASELAQPGQMVGPAQAVPVGSEAEEQPDQGGAPGDGDAGVEDAPPGPARQPNTAAKAELVAYRRWLAKRDGRTMSRAFQFSSLTEADARAAGVDLALVEFVGKAEGVAGRAPKVRHWPGWERDLQVAEHWAPLLHQALTGAPSGLLRLATDFARTGLTGASAARAFLVERDLPIVGALTPPMHGLWTDGYVVGALSSRAVLSHLLGAVKADTATVTLGVDWGSWTPGDEVAARELLGAEGMGEGLAALLEHDGVVIKGIAGTLLDRLAAILADGVEKGLSPAQIAHNLRGLVDDAKWAYRIALTETTRAVSSATLLRYARNGVDAKEWLTAADQRVCPMCAGNEDEGPVPLGLTFADGNDAPPAHPLCRCSLAPAWMTAQDAVAAGADLPMLAGLGADELGAVVTREVEDVFAELEAEIDEFGESAATAAARAASAEIEAARAVAEVVAETYEWVGTGAEGDVIARNLAQYGARFGVDVDELVRLARAGDRAALLDEADAMAERSGLVRVGTPGDRSGLVRARHELIGAPPAQGEVVEVVRPGFRATLSSGDEVLLSKARVEAVAPGEPVGAEMPVRLPRPAAPVATEADPALRMTVAELKQAARDANVPLFGATRKADIVANLRQWESVYSTKIPGLPEWKPPRVRLGAEIDAPPLVAPAADGPVLSGATLNDWADYFRHDFEQGRFRFTDPVTGDTGPKGVRVHDLRVTIGRSGPNGYGDYVVADGTAWRFNGVSYLIEHPPGEAGSPWVSRTLADLRSAHETIPAAERANKSYAVLTNGNPADSYWRARFNNPGHTSAMSAGDGHINIWNLRGPRTPGGLYGRVDVQSLRHETGHNLDDLLGRVVHGSESRAWSAAADADVRTARAVTDLRPLPGDYFQPAQMQFFDPARAWSKGVTDYGRSSKAEDYAESVMLYQRGSIAQGRLAGAADVGPIYFRDLFPARAKILDEVFPDLAAAQKAEIRALREAADLPRMTRDQLRALAKERGVTGYSRLTKPQLIERLRAAETPGEVLRPETLPKFGEPMTPAEATMRQGLIDEARKVADLVGEVGELLDSEAEPAVLRARLTASARRLGVPDAVRDRLLKAVESGDPQKIARALSTSRSGARLKAIGTPGKTTKFDPAVHKPLGERPKPGAKVEIVRAGHTVTLPSGEVVQLDKAVVEVVEDTKPIADVDALRSDLAQREPVRLRDLAYELGVDVKTPLKRAQYTDVKTGEEFVSGTRFKTATELARDIAAAANRDPATALRVNRFLDEVAPKTVRNAGERGTGAVGRGVHDIPQVPARLGAGGDQPLRWRDGFSPGWDVARERRAASALREYGRHSYEINMSLRGLLETAVRPTAKTEEFIAGLDDILNASRLTEEMTTWRGIQSAREMFGALLDGDLTGTEWLEEGFTSTSARMEVSQHFATLGGDGMLMRVRVPEGTGVAQVKDLRSEAEALLERGLRMRIVKDYGRQPGWGYRLVDVEIVAA